jgi:hypothetical protein
MYEKRQKVPDNYVNRNRKQIIIMDYCLAAAKKILVEQVIHHWIPKSTQAINSTTLIKIKPEDYDRAVFYLLQAFEGINAGEKFPEPHKPTVYKKKVWTDWSI